MTKLLISADRVLPAPGLPVVTGGAVLVEDGLITAVGRAADFGAEVPRRHFPGATVLAGMIDCHVHLAFDAGPDPLKTVAQADPAELSVAMAKRAADMLASGVTTVRDLGDRDHLAVALRKSVPGLRILTAGVPVTCENGHCGFLGGEVRTDDEIRALIDRNAAAGVDLIKVMASGGALTPGGPRMWESQFTSSQLRLVVSEAARHGLDVAAHAHGTDAIADCVDAGVRTLEHCSWRDETGIRYEPSVTRRIVERDVAVCRCVSGDWRLFLAQMGPERSAAMIDFIRQMRCDGVRFVAGTDAGVPGAHFGDYVGMLEFFAQIGFSAVEVLAMATSNAAHALGLDDSGTLTAGKRADLIVVEGDPLTDLSALRRVRHVLGKGSS